MQTQFGHTSISAVQILGRPETWPAEAVYVGMPGKAARAFGIPDQAVGPFGKPWACLNDPRGWAHAYREYLYLRLVRDAAFREAVKALHGKTLVCWCASRPSAQTCHAQFLAKAVEWLNHDVAEGQAPANVNFAL